MFQRYDVEKRARGGCSQSSQQDVLMFDPNEEESCSEADGWPDNWNRSMTLTNQVMEGTKGYVKTVHSMDRLWFSLVVIGEGWEKTYIIRHWWFGCWDERDMVNPAIHLRPGVLRGFCLLTVAVCCPWLDCWVQISVLPNALHEETWLMFARIGCQFTTLYLFLSSRDGRASVMSIRLCDEWMSETMFLSLVVVSCEGKVFSYQHAALLHAAVNKKETGAMEVIRPL